MAFLTSSAIVENRTQSSQNSKSQERANVKRIEDWRDNVPEEIQIRITEISNGGQRLTIPRNVREPAKQNSNHQHTAVDVEPLR